MRVKNKINNLTNQGVLVISNYNKFQRRENNFEHRIDNQIRELKVLVIDHNGTNLGVISVYEAQKIADQEGFVPPTKDPRVASIKQAIFVHHPHTTYLEIAEAEGLKIRKSGSVSDFFYPTEILDTHRARILEIIGNAHKEHRAILFQRAIERKHYDQIAEKLGLSENHVRETIREYSDKLRQHFVEATLEPEQVFGILRKRKSSIVFEEA